MIINNKNNSTENHKVLGLITARGGSKGLLGKNIRDLCGKPLIAWSIEVGLKSKYIDELAVSTDSQEIADIALQYGAQVPFMRPSELACDTATSVDVIEHAINHYWAKGREFDYIVLIEPTSPLREVSDIDNALEQMIKSEADSIVSVCMAESAHPAFLFTKSSENRLKSFLGDSFKVLRRQDLEPIFFLDGTVYASSVSALLDKRTFCHENTIGYEVPKWKSLEIDDIYDFIMVEAIINYRMSIK